MIREFVVRERTARVLFEHALAGEESHQPEQRLLIQLEVCGEVRRFTHGGVQKIGDSQLGGCVETLLKNHCTGHLKQAGRCIDKNSLSSHRFPSVQLQMPFHTTLRSATRGKLRSLTVFFICLCDISLDQTPRKGRIFCYDSERLHS